MYKPFETASVMSYIFVKHGWCTLTKSALEQCKKMPFSGLLRIEGIGTLLNEFYLFCE